MFQCLAICSAKAAKAHPAGILFILQITTAVLSAFLDNVTTVLLIVPVTLAICSTLKVPAYPYLFAEIFASNIGGTATLIGDPPENPDPREVPRLCRGGSKSLTFPEVAHR